MEHGQLLETVEGSPRPTAVEKPISMTDVIRIACHYRLPPIFAERFEGDGEEERPDSAEVEAGWSSIDSWSMSFGDGFTFSEAILAGGDQRVRVGAALITC